MFRFDHFTGNSFVHRYAAYIIVLLIMALPLFGHLDEHPVQVWDELRNAQNALEMSRSGRLIVTTFNGTPETWNTKPPLLIWLIALCYRLFGYNELAMRLPSAIAAALTCFLLLRFSIRRLATPLPGIIAVLILVTTPGYITMHGARTGDYDAPLVFFITAAMLWLVDFAEDGKPRCLYASALALLAAVMTKSVAGLFIIPAMLLYLMYRVKAAALFKSRHFYYCLLLFIIPIAAYYGLREMQQPGYLKLVNQNELFGRYGVATETHAGDERAYYRELFGTGFPLWSWLLIPALLSACFSRDALVRRYAFMAGAAALSIFALLNFSATKLSWYLMPLYPFLALFCALFLYQCCVILADWAPATARWKPNFLPLLLLIALAWKPYEAMIDYCIYGNYHKDSIPEHDAAVYLKEALAGNRPLGATVLCSTSAYGVFWYERALRLKGMPVAEQDTNSALDGLKVMAWEPAVKRHIAQRYDAAVKDSFRSVVVYELKGRRP